MHDYKSEIENLIMIYEQYESGIIINQNQWTVNIDKAPVQIISLFVNVLNK